MCKLTVLENNSMGFILGLDNMRSHRSIINLQKNSIEFQDAEIIAHFLSDGEARKLKSEEEDEDDSKIIKDAEEESLKNLK